jgi:hypothetical protein
LAARGVEPDDADAVAFLHGLDVLANAGDETDALVARDERRPRLDGPVALGGVQVGMTYAADFHLDLYFFRTGFWDCHLFDY